MVLLAFDLVLIGGSGYMLWNRAQIRLMPPKVSASVPAASNPPPQQTVPLPVEKASVEENREAAPVISKKAPTKRSAKESRTKTAESGPIRKILFKYHDSVPKEVSIAGDFTDWSPQLMRKDKNNNWSITLNLKPGQYAYNFIVDGKMIRDPANRKTKKAGQKIPSSLLVVSSKK